MPPTAFLTDTQTKLTYAWKCRWPRLRYMKMIWDELLRLYPPALLLPRVGRLLILATIASTVRLRLVDGQTIRPDPVMTLRPDVPVQMIVQRVAIAEPHPAHG